MKNRERYGVQHLQCIGGVHVSILMCSLNYTVGQMKDCSGCSQTHIVGRLGVGEKLE